jgi:putative membrane protein
MVPDNLKAAIPASLRRFPEEDHEASRHQGRRFRGGYDPMQVSAHEDAVSLFERYANGGDDAKLKDWAGKTLAALKHHLEMAQTLDKNRK